VLQEAGMKPAARTVISADGSITIRPRVLKGLHSIEIGKANEASLICVSTCYSFLNTYLILNSTKMN
jgi:hypothetical protein